MKYFIASDIHGSAYYCRRLLEAMNGKGLTDWSSSATSSITDRATTFPRTIIRKTSLPCSTKEGCHPLRPRQLRQRSRSDGPGISHHAPYAILTQGTSSSMQLTATIITPTACRPFKRATSCSTATPTCRFGNPLDRTIITSIPVRRPFRKTAILTATSLGRSDLYLERHGRQGLPRTDFIRSREKGAACLFGTVGIGPPSGSSPIREKSENQTDGRHDAHEGISNKTLVEAIYFIGIDAFSMTS